MAFTYDVSMFKETFEHEFTWLSGFMRNVHKFAQKTAVYCPNLPAGERSISYAKLNARANQLAHALQARGVTKNDIIMFMLLNSPEFIYTYVAAHKLGAIACPVNYRQSSGELSAILEDSRPAIFIYDDSVAKTVRSAFELSEFQPTHLVCVHGRSEKLSYESENLCARDFYALVKGMSRENPV
ncbi:MAG: AMP-binding protein, partial [Desulfovibrio sp.]|nr:AMP-binding protein [Desulfovibrio sp.]